MRILFVQKEGGIFGAENYQLKVIPGLVAKGVKLEFLRLYTDYQGGKGGDFIDLLEEMNVKTYEVNIGKYPTFSVINKIKKVVSNGDFDIVHSHLIHADFHMALVKLLFKSHYALVSTKHGYDNTFTSKFGFDASKQKSTPYFLISRWAQKHMTSSFTISRGLHNFFIETGLAKRENMSLIHYGFDMPNHADKKHQLKYRLGKKQLIIAGRLVGFKGHRYLLESMVALKKKFGEELMLVIAGTGQLEAELKEQVSQNDLSDVVTFLGYSKEVGAYMANSDVVVIPSVSEGFGVVFLEAFAAKTPVVSWDVPSGNELISDHKSGYLARPYDTDHLAECIASVLRNPDKQGDIVDEAYERLISYFNLDRMIEETVEFYKKTLEDI